MSFETFIAAKHLTRRQKTGFISLVSLISILGVGIGVWALIIVLAVMSGFDQELKSKIVNVQPHLRIERSGGIEDFPEVINYIRSLGLPDIKNIAPYTEGQGILKSKTNAIGLAVKGLDPEREDMAIYEQHLRVGDLDLKDEIEEKTVRRFLFFKKKQTKRTHGILIGEVLASTLHVRVGDTVTLITPYSDAFEKMSLANAESRTFSVRGIFRIGMNQFDSQLALIDLKVAQSMYHLGDRVGGISLRFHNVDTAENYKHYVRQNFTASYYINSWYDMNHNFFQALRVEKSVMTILLSLIISVAAFNIIASLTMVVMEKTKDIGILRAIGATRQSIRKIFLIEGFSIGFVGVVLGGITGVVSAFNLNPISDFLKNNFGIEIFPSDVYIFDRIPAEVHMEDVVLTVIFALLAALFAGFYPAHRAASLNPIEALRYE